MPINKCESANCHCGFCEKCGAWNSNGKLCSPCSMRCEDCSVYEASVTKIRFKDKYSTTSKLLCVSCAATYNTECAVCKEQHTIYRNEVCLYCITKRNFPPTSVGECDNCYQQRVDLYKGICYSCKTEEIHTKNNRAYDLCTTLDCDSGDIKPVGLRCIHCATYCSCGRKTLNNSGICTKCGKQSH